MQGAPKETAKTVELCLRARLQRLRKNSRFAISVVWLVGTFPITNEGAPYLARCWPDVRKSNCWRESANRA
jgi:hypothetical protein